MSVIRALGKKAVLVCCRKADLRELKLLQKVENRQYQDLVFKAQYMRDQQEKKFEQEMQVSVHGVAEKTRLYHATKRLCSFI